MPRFVKDGPIVPDRLVQELEEDRVVIFCGAGISMGAGLPSFRGLVEHCYMECGAPMPDPDHDEWTWLDRMLGSLEATHEGQMRIKVAERLDAPLKRNGLAMHEAILKLARLRGSANGTRLVTTNFDLLFEQARPGMHLGVDYHSGPVLPIPRNDRLASWRSIVYLHGRLEAPGHGNQHLVLTSADFGRAYLTDAWAARFVARLFAEFTVLFIGYSLNDPVLRYMTDAFAAEDALARSGRKRGPAYIFVPDASHTPDPTPYRLRRLEPIYYRPIYDHRLLKTTLIEWAKAREDYLASVRTTVERNAPIFPNALEPSDAANLVWAVCGRPGDGGHGARVFASLDEPPPIEWLQEFETHDVATRTDHEADLERASKEERDPPAAPLYHIAPLFPYRTDNSGTPALSDAARELLPWICAHLEDQKLVDWVVAKLALQRRAHPQLRRAIQAHLDRTPAIADGYRAFWRIVASEGDWANDTSPHFSASGISTANLAERYAPWFGRELAAALRPYLRFSQSFAAATGGIVDPARVSTIAEARVHLAGEELDFVVEQLNGLPDAPVFWAGHLEMLTRLLEQVFELQAVVGQATPMHDLSAFQRPSIIPHAQNRHHADWTRLFDYIWKGWEHVDGQADPRASRGWATRWRRVPFPGFRRLALAAMTHSRHFTPEEKLEALLHG